MRSFIAYGFLAPPALFITLCLAGVLVLPIWPRFGFATVLVGSLSLFAAATPAISSYLVHRLEAEVPASPNLEAAQAIVVLSGDETSATAQKSLTRLARFHSSALRSLRMPIVNSICA